MGGETVYTKEGILATFDESNGVLWVGLSHCPDNDAIDKMWTVVSTFVTNHPTKCVVHLAHVDSPELEPPGLPTMLHIVSKIVTEFSDMSKKCKQIIVQPKYIDDKVMFAQQVFRGLIDQKVPLEITDKPKKIEKLIRILA